MQIARTVALVLTCALFPCSVGQLLAADRQPRGEAANLKTNSKNSTQSGDEKLNLDAYARIREEGLTRSHVMELASALVDDIGPRITGSPNMKKANEWTRDQLTRLGLDDVHLEDWGEFGMGWQQLNTWVRMVSPDTMPLIAQASPWSPSTNGPVTGEAVNVVINNQADFDRYKGKLAGKIVLLGEMRRVEPVEKPLFTLYTDQDLEEITRYEPRDRNFEQKLQDYLKSAALRDEIAPFLASEKVAGVILPSRDAEDSGASGGTFLDDYSDALGVHPFRAEKAVKVPCVVAAIENYGRIYRLLQAHVPVTVQMNVETQVSGNHEHGFNTLAEIRGTDPELKDQVVMIGAHLDSWASATGATDNGAGVVAAMEAMRILKSLDIQPRRTIRIALWSGEEEGLFGSRHYVSDHFASYPVSTTPDQLKLPEIVRTVVGPIEKKPGWNKLDVYFTVDGGSGRIRGIYLQGNSAVEPIFRQWIAPLADLGVTAITMRSTLPADHHSFDAVGLPGFEFLQDPTDYESRSHHSNMDTYERLQPDDLAQIATVEAIFLYNAAMRDGMIPRKPLPHPEHQASQTVPMQKLYPDSTSRSR